MQPVQSNCAGFAYFMRFAKSNGVMKTDYDAPFGLVSQHAVLGFGASELLPRKNGFDSRSSSVHLARRAETER